MARLEPYGHRSRASRLGGRADACADRLLLVQQEGKPECAVQHPLEALEAALQGCPVAANITRAA